MRRGQRVVINASGRVSLGNNRTSRPDGIPDVSDRDKMMRHQPTGGLFGVIGDDNDDFIFIGRERDYVSPRDGVLFLGVNEGNLTDNKGCYDVVIEFESDSSGFGAASDRVFLKNGSVLDGWTVYKFEQDSFKITDGKSEFSYKQADIARIEFSTRASESLDLIKLKDESRIRGRVVNFKDEQVTVSVEREGRKTRVTVYIEDIETIEWSVASNAP
jgi:hypothetical protein